MKEKALFLWAVTGITVVLHTICCATIPKYINKEAVKGYEKLSSSNKSTVNDIVEKISSKPKKERKYYVGKLNSLLSTPTAKSNSNEAKELANKNESRLDESVKSVEKRMAKMSRKDMLAYIRTEEEYEQFGERDWEVYQPDENDAIYLVDKTDVTNILVKIFIHLEGKPGVVRKVLHLEDAIEKHVSIPGFSVNITFMREPENFTFIVDTDTSKWITSHNWGGTPQMMAHELMHLMGLPDEYDGIAEHAENEHLSMSTRLWYFKKQLSQPFLPDAKYGIMTNHNNRPLHRHACKAVGLDKQPCTRIRKEYWGN